MDAQKAYQDAVLAGLGDTDDNAILSLDSSSLEELNGTVEDKATEVENDDVAEAADTETAGTEVEKNDDKPAMYTKDQVQAIIRTRVANLEKKMTRLQQSESALDKLVEVSGLSKDQLITRLNSMSDAEQAKILGVPPEQVAAMRVARNAQVESEKQIKKLNRDLEMTQLKSDKKYADIDLFLDDILAKVEDHPSLSLKDAYTLVKGELGLTAKIRDAEQRVLNSQASAKSKALAKPVGGAQAAPAKMSEFAVKGAKQVGMDPNEYAAFQNIDNIDAYRAYKKSQKG